jgi:hypothetical protein
VGSNPTPSAIQSVYGPETSFTVCQTAAKQTTRARTSDPRLKSVAFLELGRGNGNAKSPQWS